MRWSLVVGSMEIPIDPEPAPRGSPGALAGTPGEGIQNVDPLAGVPRSARRLVGRLASR